MQQAYQEGLADIPLPDLHAACDQLVKSSTFMPKVAEIREAASRTMNRRLARQARCRMLVLRHERDWVDPCDMLTPVDAANLSKIMAGPLAKRDHQ